MRWLSFRGEIGIGYRTKAYSVLGKTCRFTGFSSRLIVHVCTKNSQCSCVDVSSTPHVYTPQVQVSGRRNRIEDFMLPFIAIQQYGLSLRQMRDADMEIVRNGRNQPFVRENHFFQEFITPEQHRTWYDGVCKTRDYYLIVCKDDVPLGLISLKNIAPSMRTGQLGIFFWEKHVLRTRLPLLAIITFIDFFLFTVGVQHMEAIIRSNNAAMAHIFEFFRFDLIYDRANNILRTGSTRNQYLENHDRLIDFARRLNKTPASWQLRIEGEKDARHHPEVLRVIP